MLDGRDEEASVYAQIRVYAHVMVLEREAVAIGADLAQSKLILLSVVVD